MVWLALVLLLIAFQRGWVLAPMVLFALPFALPFFEASFVQQGLDFSYLIPDAIEGHAAQVASIAGLLALALHQRRF